MGGGRHSEKGWGGWTKQGGWAAGGSVDRDGDKDTDNTGGGGHCNNKDHDNKNNDNSGWMLQRYGPSRSGYDIRRRRDCAEHKYEAIFDDNIGISYGRDDGNVSSRGGGACIIRAMFSCLVIIAAVCVLVVSLPPTPRGMTITSIIAQKRWRWR
jgi:hypothetical protein